MDFEMEDLCTNSTEEELIQTFDPYRNYVSSSWFYNILISSFFGLVSIGAIVGNSAAIYLLIRTRDTFLSGNAGKLLVNLSIADLVTGCFSIPFRFQMVLFQHWAYGAAFCYLSCFVDNWSLFSSVYTLLMIALDRYVAVVTPFSMLFKRISLKWWIALIWLLSILSAMPATLISSNQQITNPCTGEVFRTLCYQKLDFQLHVDMFVMVTSYIMPLIFMTVFYTAITRRLIQSSRVVSNTTVLGQTHAARNQKVVRVLIAVVSIFLLCWLPLRSYQIIKFISPSILVSPLVPKFYLAAYWLGVSNSTWNPIIYSFYFIKNKKENQANEAIAAKDAANAQKVEERKNNNLKPPAKSSLYVSQKGGGGTEISSAEAGRFSKRAADTPENRIGETGGKTVLEEKVPGKEGNASCQDEEKEVIGGGGHVTNGVGKELIADIENYGKSSLQNGKCHYVEGTNNAESYL